jgi:hypothetical protein
MTDDATKSDGDITEEDIAQYTKYAKEEFQKFIEAIKRGEHVDGFPLDPMNEEDRRAIPKVVRGWRERRHHIYWHAWIADTRPDGLGVNKGLRFATDAGDLSRTNMLCAGCLVGDRTFRVKRIGIHAAFSDKRHYAAFFRSCRLSFIVGDKPMIELPASYYASEDRRFDPLEMADNKLHDPPRPTYEDGYCGFLDLTRNIAIPARQGLGWLLECEDPHFVRDMQLIESGALFASYAEIMIMIEGEETREIC